MIKIEIDGDKKEFIAKGASKDIMFETIAALQVVFVSLAKNEREYHSALSFLAEVIMRFDYNEIKEMMESE